MKQWEDLNLPIPSAYPQEQRSYLVSFVNEDYIWSEDNPSSLPRWFAQYRDLVRLLPIHPSLKIDHNETEMNESRQIPERDEGNEGETKRSEKLSDWMR